MLRKHLVVFLLWTLCLEARALTCSELFSVEAFTQSKRPLVNPDYAGKMRKELEQQYATLLASNTNDPFTIAKLKQIEKALSSKEIGLEIDRTGIAHFDPAMAPWSTRGGKFKILGPNRVELMSNWISRRPFTARINFEEATIAKLGEPFFGGNDDLATHLAFRVRGPPGKTWTLSIEKRTQSEKIIPFNFQFETNGELQDLYLPINDFTSGPTPEELAQMIQEPAPKFFKAHAEGDPRIGEWATNRFNVSASQTGSVSHHAYAISITLDPKLSHKTLSIFENRRSSLFIESEFVFEKDLREPKLIRAASELILNRVNFYRSTHQIDQDHRKLPNETTQAEIENFLTKISRILYNRANIEISLTTLLKGEAAIRDEMDGLGVGLVPLDSKIDDDDFFELGRRMDIAQPAVPLDTGSFGDRKSVV